jgi:hypothetical protein
MTKWKRISMMYTYLNGKEEVFKNSIDFCIKISYFHLFFQRVCPMNFLENYIFDNLKNLCKMKGIMLNKIFHFILTIFCFYYHFRLVTKLKINIQKINFLNIFVLSLLLFVFVLIIVLLYYFY